MSTTDFPITGPSYPSPLRDRSFAIEDPSSVWMVRDGTLDVFLEPLAESGMPGARHHLLRIEAGGALFGLPSTGSEMRLTATPSPGAGIERLPLLDIQQNLALESCGTADLIDRWILNLGRTASDGRTPDSSVAIDHGRTLTIPFQPKPVAPPGGVVWVKHEKGHSTFPGRAGERIGAEALFPITRSVWIEAAPRSVLKGHSTADLAELDPTWSGFGRFQTLAVSRIVDNYRRLRDREEARLRAKLAGDAELMQAGLMQLATPLASVPAAATQTTTFPDPVFLACEAAAGALGIRLKPHPDMFRGIPMPDPVAQIARASGVRVRRVALRADWWREDGGPIVAFRDKDQRPVALLPASPGRYEIYDPVERVSSPVKTELALTLSPLAYVFYRPFPNKALGLLDLFRFGLQGCRREVATILWAGMGAGFLGMAIPFATSILFNNYVPAAERTQVLGMSIFLLVIVLSIAMLMVARGFAVLRLEGKMDSSIQAALWDRLLNLPVPFFRNYSSGDLAMRSLGIIQIRQAITGSTLTSILSGIFSLFSLALLFFYSWRLALVATGLVIVAFLTSALCGGLQMRAGREIFRMRGATTGMVSQFINGVAKLRVAGAEARAFAAWARQFSQQRQISIRSRQTANMLRVFVAVYPLVCQAVLFSYHAHLLADPTVPPMSTGDFLAFLAGFTQFLTAVLMLSSSVTTVLDVVPLYERALPILRTLPEVDVARSMPGPLNGDIEVSNLTFRYKPESPLVLRGISLKIEAGQFVAFVGSSGCGKSTLFRLLLGFEVPESGAIYYDGKDLSGLDVQAVRRQMGVVLQTSKLASGDIFTNIIGSSNLTINDAWEAARLAGIEDDIKRLPMGMHTVISEGGGGFSGGQRQRLLIARAVVNKPRILLFDEATSALDNLTQSAVSRSLESLQTTRIVIAHRLSTIMNADRIYVVDKGNIVQSGSYNELMAQEGLFRELALRQLA